MVVGAKVCDLTEDLLWFVCGLYVVSPLIYLSPYVRLSDHNHTRKTTDLLFFPFLDI